MEYMNKNDDYVFSQAKIYLDQIPLDLAKSWDLYEFHRYEEEELFQSVLNKILKNIIK